jgi:hypothetical protein
MPEKDQILLYTEAQLSLIKNTFAENEPLLFAIRNVFFQFPLTDGQKDLLKLVNDDVIEVLKIRMLPTLSPTLPIGQLQTVVASLQEQMKASDPEFMAPRFDAKMKQIAYLEQQFDKLKNPNKEEMLKLSEMGHLMGKTPYQQFVDLDAYLFLIGYIDPMLAMIRSIAGAKNETPEQQKKRMTRDTNK